MTGNCHVRCGAGENSEMISKNYLSLFGKVPNFNETLAVVRSYNIRICIVVQGLSQLKAMYEKTWDSIIGNCSIFTFLGTNDNESKEYVSKKLGKTTVRVETKSYDRGKGGGQDNENYIQRDLLAPDEISQAIKPKGKTKKYGGSCIIFVDEHKPMFIPKYDTMHHSLFNVTGSSFPKGIPNNTDVRETYGKIYEEHKNNHTQAITDFFEIDKQNQIEDAERLQGFPEDWTKPIEIEGFKIYDRKLHHRKWLDDKMGKNER